MSSTALAEAAWSWLGVTPTPALASALVTAVERAGYRAEVFEPAEGDAMQRGANAGEPGGRHAKGL